MKLGIWHRSWSCKGDIELVLVEITGETEKTYYVKFWFPGDVLPRINRALKKSVFELPPDLNKLWEPQNT